VLFLFRLNSKAATDLVKAAKFKKIGLGSKYM